MARVLLDIGAGGEAFAKRVIRFNDAEEGSFHILCGDKRFTGEWDSTHTQPGIERIYACYDDFMVPDGSLDIVALNGCDSFCGAPLGLQSELLRTLKPGGTFFSASAVGVHPSLCTATFEPIPYVTVDKMFASFEEHVDGGTHEGEWWWAVETTVTNGLKIIYPASPVILDRIVALRMAELHSTAGPPVNFAHYTSSASPSLRIWVKRTADGL